MLENNKSSAAESSVVKNSRLVSLALISALLLGAFLFKFVVKNDGDRCFDVVKNSLKDPETAKVMDYSAINGKVKIDVRAANSYGAFGRIYFTCNADGTTESYDSDHKLNWDLDF